MSNQQKEKVSSISLPQPPPTLEHDTNIPYLQLENYRFHYRVYGEENKDAVIVLHGGPGGDFRYLLTVQALASRYKVIFYDHRGTGLSPRTHKRELHLEQYLKDLDAFVSHFGDKGNVNLLGHSWGAYLALQYVALYPNKINKLVLAEPFIPYPSINLKILLHNLQTGILKKLLTARKESRSFTPIDKQAQEDYFFSYVLQKSNPGYNCPGVATSPDLWRASRQAYLSLSFSLRSKMAEKKLRDIHYPVDKMLLLVGECNELLGKKYNKKVQRQLRYPEMITIPQAGHYLFNDNPAACIREILEFLDREV